jgi:hypothetical protein
MAFCKYALFKIQKNHSRIKSFCRSEEETQCVIEWLETDLYWVLLGRETGESTGDSPGPEEFLCVTLHQNSHVRVSRSGHLASQWVSNIICQLILLLPDNLKDLRFDLSGVLLTDYPLTLRIAGRFQNE